MVHDFCVAHARPVSLYGESVMTRFNEVGFVSGAEHSNDSCVDFGMRCDFFDTLGFDLVGGGEGDGDGEEDGGVFSIGRQPGKFSSRYVLILSEHAAP